MSLKERVDRLPHYSMALRVKPYVGDALEELSKRMGVNKTAVIVLALRKLAKEEGVSFGEASIASQVEAPIAEKDETI